MCHRLGEWLGEWAWRTWSGGRAVQVMWAPTWVDLGVYCRRLTVSPDASVCGEMLALDIILSMCVCLSVCLLVHRLAVKQNLVYDRMLSIWYMSGDIL